MFFEHNFKENQNQLILKYVDLFCGIGGFRVALDLACSNYKKSEKKIKPICVFSSDINPDAQKNHEVNFNEKPAGDITKIAAESVPNHNLLLAGFPCQPFSISGKLQGFEDTHRIKSKDWRDEVTQKLLKLLLLH